MKCSIVAVIITVYVCGSVCFRAVPLLLASHKVVPQLLPELGETRDFTYSSTVVTNMLKKHITHCSSDVYLVVDQPGLRYDDLTDRHRDTWKFIYKYYAIASTAIGVSWINDPLDLDYIGKYIVSTCDAEIMAPVHEDENEVPPYYDTRTRVITVKLPPLEDSTRFEQLAKNDELLRKILRKLPSPHYTIILTSSTDSGFHPLPRSVIENDPESYTIFSLVTNDPSRKDEIERNDRFHRPDPDWIENKHTNNRYIRNKKQDEIHFFDYELWSKYEKLIMTLFVMMLTICMKKIYDGLNWAKQKIKSKSNPGLIATNTKSD